MAAAAFADQKNRRGNPRHPSSVTAQSAAPSFSALPPEVMALVLRYTVSDTTPRSTERARAVLDFSHICRSARRGALWGGAVDNYGEALDTLADATALLAGRALRRAETLQPLPLGTIYPLSVFRDVTLWRLTEDTGDLERVGTHTPALRGQREDTARLDHHVPSETACVGPRLYTAELVLHHVRKSGGPLPPAAWVYVCIRYRGVPLSNVDAAARTDFFTTSGDVPGPFARDDLTGGVRISRLTAPDAFGNYESLDVCEALMADKRLVRAEDIAHAYTEHVRGVPASALAQRRATSMDVALKREHYIEGMRITRFAERFADFPYRLTPQCLRMARERPPFITPPPPSPLARRRNRAVRVARAGVPAEAAHKRARGGGYDGGGASGGADGGGR